MPLIQPWGKISENSSHRSQDRDGKKVQQQELGLKKKKKRTPHPPHKNFNQYFWAQVRPAPDCQLFQYFKIKRKKENSLSKLTGSLCWGYRDRSQWGSGRVRAKLQAERRVNRESGSRRRETKCYRTVHYKWLVRKGQGEEGKFHVTRIFQVQHTTLSAGNLDLWPKKWERNMWRDGDRFNTGIQIKHGEAMNTDEQSSWDRWQAHTDLRPSHTHGKGVSMD